MADSGLLGQLTPHGVILHHPSVIFVLPNAISCTQYHHEINTIHIISDLANCLHIVESCSHSPYNSIKAHNLQYLVALLLLKEE